MLLIIVKKTKQFFSGHRSSGHRSTGAAALPPDDFLFARTAAPRKHDDQESNKKCAAAGAVVCLSQPHLISLLCWRCWPPRRPAFRPPVRCCVPAQVWQVRPRPLLDEQPRDGFVPARHGVVERSEPGSTGRRGA